MSKVSREEGFENSIRCVFCRDVAATLAEHIDLTLESTDDVRVVTIGVERLGAVEACIRSYVTALADAARLLWPDWYDGAITLVEDVTTSEAAVADQIAALQLRRRQPRAIKSWLIAAIAACRSSRSPILSQFSSAIQAEQLAAALRKRRLLLFVSVKNDSHSSFELQSFARSLEWLARQASAEVVAVLPFEFADRKELDSVSFAATVLDEAITDDSNKTSHHLGKVEEHKERVGPIIGRPHPGSPGEQLLATFLSRDAELGPLFRFNERVVTTFGNRTLVDLVWPEGRIAVEIDGYGYHSTPAAFNADRYRDYELTLSGFLVLRLPHDFVVQDVALAAERVREFVRFRMQHPHIERKVFA